MVHIFFSFYFFLSICVLCFAFPFFVSYLCSLALCIRILVFCSSLLVIRGSHLYLIPPLGGEKDDEKSGHLSLVVLFYLLQC
eukprot:Gb_09823 [translate_table: standard]